MPGYKQMDMTTQSNDGADTTAPAPQHDVSAFADVQISEALIRRFDRQGPRYTSYPTADRFSDAFDERAYREHLSRRASAERNPPLSVYLHLPFCESLCYFCACNKIITQDHTRTSAYVDYLIREMELVAPDLGRDRRTTQLHLGGGSPTFFAIDELARLMRALREHFDFAPHAELGVEIDPRTVNERTLQSLAALGFNRTSFGVQDFARADRRARGIRHADPARDGQEGDRVAAEPHARALLARAARSLHARARRRQWPRHLHSRRRPVTLGDAVLT